MVSPEILPHPLRSEAIIEKPAPQVAVHHATEDSTVNTSNRLSRAFSGPNGPLIKDLAVTILVLAGQLVFFVGVKKRNEHISDIGEPILGTYGFKIFGTTTNCDQLKHQRSALSLTVNVIAALVMLFTPGTLHVLSAPTRRILDECHSNKKYMEIGAPSFHNIISGSNRWSKRFWLWVLLFLTALPFHLLYNSVIVLSIPAAQSYQVTLSDTFFTIPRAQLEFNIDSPSEETFSSMTTMATTSTASAQIASPSSNNAINNRVNIRTADQLIGNSSVLYAKDTKEQYATSPFVAFGTNSTTEWPGLDQVDKDIISLLQNTNIWNSSMPWQELFVNSTDWSMLDFHQCLNTFSIRYRPYAGTVFLVLGMSDSMDPAMVDNDVLGMSYLSYHVSSLAIVCPTAYANGTGTGLVNDVEDAPVLPLLYGSFDKPQPEGTDMEVKPRLEPPEFTTCPSQDNDRTAPRVKGCLLRNRASFCRLGYNSFFFCAILGLLVIKIVLLSYALYHCRNQRPLLTVGDTIAEYLQHEDEHTKESCLQSTGSGWEVVHAPLPAATPNTKTSGQWLKFWRLVYPGRSAVLTDRCLREDIISYSNKSDRGEIPSWVTAYMVTLMVTAAVFTYVGLQDGWVVKPTRKGDLRWVIWPSILVNCPQFFCSARNLCDTRILTSRNSKQELAGYAVEAQGLRVSEPKPKTAQRHLYFIGNMNFLVSLTLTALQTLYSFILGQLLIPQWINPLDPSDRDDTFSPQFLLRFGTTQRRSAAVNTVIIVVIIIFPFIGIYIVNAIATLVVRCRTLKVSDLSDFIPQFLQEVFCIPKKLQIGSRGLKDTTALLPRIPVQMPGPAMNSQAIALACHPLSEERGTQMEEKRLRWGVVKWSNDMGRGGHCSFTAYPYQGGDGLVGSQRDFVGLEPGKLYTGIRNEVKRRCC